MTLTSSDSDATSDEDALEKVTDGSAAYGKKHYQIGVPDFTQTDGTTHVGTSFLRIGSSFDQSTVAAITATDSHPIRRAEKASLDLAKLVGDRAAIGAAESLTSETAGGETYGGDGNYLLGFADDTRYRKEDGANETRVFSGSTGTNTRANRQAETQKLLSKGGWWDHSDGNRITTTSGDKIEVIQGNYKMVVLGRQDVSLQAGEDEAGRRARLAAGGLITDVSGGHFQEQYASPTPCIKTVEFKQTALGSTEWTLFQDNGNGNVHTHFGWGDITDTYEVRSKTTHIGIWNDETRRTVIEDKVWASSITGTTNASGEIGSDVTAGSIKSSVDTGHVDSYTKASGLVQTNTVAGQISTFQTAKAITNLNTAANHFNLTVGLQENVNVGLVLNLYASAVLSLGVNATSVNGVNNTYDGTKLTATLTETNVHGIQTALRGTGTVIEGVRTRLGMNSVDVENETVFVGNLAASMRAMTLL